METSVLFASDQESSAKGTARRPSRVQLRYLTEAAQYGHAHMRSANLLPPSIVLGVFRGTRMGIRYVARSLASHDAAVGLVANGTGKRDARKAKHQNQGES